MRSSTAIFALYALCLVNAAYIPIVNLLSSKAPPGYESSLNENSPKSLFTNLEPELAPIKRATDLLVHSPSSAALRKRQIHNADYSTKEPNAPQNVNSNSTSVDDSSGSSNGAESDSSVSQQNAQKRDTFVEADARDHQHQTRDPHHFLLSEEKAHRRRRLPRDSKGPLIQSAPVHPGVPHNKVDGRSVLSSLSHMVSRALRNTIWFSARAAPARGHAPPKLPVDPKDGLPVHPSRPSRPAPKAPEVPKREVPRDVQIVSKDALPSPQRLSSAAAADSAPEAPNAPIKQMVSSLAGVVRGSPKTLKPEADKVAVHQHPARWSSSLSQLLRRENVDKLNRPLKENPSLGHVMDGAPAMRRWMLSEPE
ncbi:hypothetical protein Moror_10246 [Moniliophthora roreri MCA 2997]|uniref:Uncharacterized protein n=2 Tax=Moniliophthora roreri TaxID=221103 RepID=V2YK46_MONRO|nr:hypothetical protein Moror_10246 [Moniliophthora roreri MCA 2997]